MKKILFVLTSHGMLGTTGQTTGYFLSELTHPWHVFTRAGYAVDFVSPLGGEPPVDGSDMRDESTQAFMASADAARAAHSMHPSEVDPRAYAAIFFVGGHGTMWDFPDHARLAEITRDVYEQGGVVSAVCHGPAGLLNTTLSDGTYLVAGKRITSFTDDEERAKKLDTVVPFLLESALRARGALFEKSDLWQAHVASHDRVVTGQNPASATPLAEEVVRILES